MEWDPKASGCSEPNDSCEAAGVSRSNKAQRPNVRNSWLYVPASRRAAFVLHVRFDGRDLAFPIAAHARSGHQSEPVGGDLSLFDGAGAAAADGADPAVRAVSGGALRAEPAL